MHAIHVYLFKVEHIVVFCIHPTNNCICTYTNIQLYPNFKQLGYKLRLKESIETFFKTYKLLIWFLFAMKTEFRQRIHFVWFNVVQNIRIFYLVLINQSVCVSKTFIKNVVLLFSFQTNHNARYTYLFVLQPTLREWFTRLRDGGTSLFFLIIIIIYPLSIIRGLEASK